MISTGETTSNIPKIPGAPYLGDSIENLLNGVKFKRTNPGGLTSEEKRIILRNLALQKTPQETTNEINLKRYDLKKEPVQISRELFYWYRKNYDEPISQCRELYQYVATKEWRLADKFTRIRILDQIGNSIEEWVRNNTKVLQEEDRSEIQFYQTQVRLLLSIFNAISNEMGKVRQVKQEITIRREPNIMDLIEASDGDKESKKILGDIIQKRYGDRLGYILPNISRKIEDVEFEATE